MYTPLWKGGFSVWVALHILFEEGASPFSCLCLRFAQDERTLDLPPKSGFVVFRGLRVQGRGGGIVDATLIQAPSSAKNAKKYAVMNSFLPSLGVLRPFSWKKGCKGGGGFLSQNGTFSEKNDH